MFTGNLAEERAKLLARRQRVIDATEDIAMEFVKIFTENTRPLARVKTGKWRDSIHGEISPVAPATIDVWLGSHGAFSPEGFNYGAYWNFFDGTIDTGLFISKPEFNAVHKKYIDDAMQDQNE